MICPHCGQENIEGVDECDGCGQPLDFLSESVLVTAVEQHLVDEPLRVLKPRDPIIVAPDAKVQDVLNLLVKQRIGCVLVVENDELVGIFSERDALVRLNTEAEQLGDRPVSDFMSPSPEALDLDDKIVFALHKMDLGGYRHVPILKDGRVAGIISIRDILRYITNGLAPSKA